MRCPKCGYNSFDHLDSCKKCNQDLAAHKAMFNIRSIVLSEMATEITTATSEDVVAADPVFSDPTLDDFAPAEESQNGDDFGFDFMGDSEDEENLAFDELFEEVANEEDVEETLPAPEASADAPVEAAPKTYVIEEEALAEDFMFDEPEDEAASDAAPDFGFDNDADPAADIFAETEEDFSLDSEDIEDPVKK